MIKKVFRQMLLTQILSAMTVMICMLVDSIIIGRFLGVDAMTAYGLSNPVLLIFASLGSMLSAGIQVVCGKYMGNGDREGTNRCFSAAVFLAAAISAVGLCLVLALSSPLCTLLGAGRPSPDNEVFVMTKDYLRGFIIGAPAFLCAMIMVPFMQMSGNRTRLVVAVAAMTAADIIFDLLNVLVFRGGTLGMGLASSFSYYIAFIIGITYFLGKKCMFRFSIRRVTKKICGEIVKNGIPNMIGQLSLVLLVFLFNKLLIDVSGTVAVASYSVISTIGNICYCFSAGIGSVALMLSSLFRGDEDRQSLYTVVKTMIYYAILLDLLVIAVVLLSAPALVGLFIKDDISAKNMAVAGLRLFSLSLVMSAMNTAFKNFYQGINMTRFTGIISFLQCFLFTAVFSVVLSRFLGTTGVWLGWVCGEAAALLFICIVVRIKSKKFRISAETFALLPDDLGASDDDCFDVTVRTSEEAVEASERSAEFCLAHGANERDSRVISLCVEEMVNNIIEHGFTKDNRKDHMIELRLVFKDGKRLIRIRDNCVNFDPIAYLELHNSEDPTVHIGIRLVMKMVKDADYICSLGLNNLTLVM